MSNIAQKPNIFYLVRDIPFPEVQRSFYGEVPKQGKILCPFHSEKTPSFQVFDDCGYCFGCQWRGDSVNFVSQLKNLKLIDAARLIASCFGLPVDRPLSREKLQQTNKLKRKRNIAKQYKKIEKEAFLNLISFKETVEHIIRVVGLDDLDSVTVKNAHKLPLIDEYLRILTEGSTDERLQLLREGVITEWARI